MSKIRVVSDGTRRGTKVFIRQGLVDVPLDGVTKIEFMPMEPGKLLEARITFQSPDIDVLADVVNEAKP